MTTIADLANRVDRIAHSFVDAMRREVAVGGLQLVANSFRTSTDPYGVTWPALKRPRPGGPVEVKTGAMRGSTLAAPTSDGVRFTVAAPYSGYQHNGTATIPQRRLLPVGFLGLPVAWSQMVQAAFSRLVKGA